MEESAGTPTVGNSPVSQHSDIDDAASPADRPPSVRDLRMFTRFDETSSNLASTFEVQTDQQNENTGPAKPSSSAHVWYKLDDVQPSLRNSENKSTALWKTVGTILGFFLTALFAALGHYVLVRQLNQKAVETSLLTQGQVSAVSILLSTIFKAALTASVGTCFAQHLWYLLRGPAMSLSTIEMLFIIRTNMFALLNPHGIYRAPLLCLMALLTWGLGIATIYPAGALTVVFEAQTITELQNISIMNPNPPSHLDLGDEGNFPILGGRNALVDGREAALMGQPQNPDVRWFPYSKPAAALTFVAQTILFNSQIFALPNHPGENSTYNLQFRGPYLNCTAAQYNSTLVLKYKPREYLKAPRFVSAWDQSRQTYSLTQHNVGNFTAERGLNSSIIWIADTVVKEQICNAQSRLYNVNVTFPRGVQTVTYLRSDAEALVRPIDIFGRGRTLTLEIPPEKQALQNWSRELSTAIPASNEWASLDTLGTLIEGACIEEMETPSLMSLSPDYLPLENLLDGSSRSSCQQRMGPSGITIFYDCGAWSDRYSTMTNSSLLKGTVFHSNRFDRYANEIYYRPESSLNLTEAMLNEVLANITISAISLGTWWDMVPVTSTRYHSTYKLSNPLNLILPYSICLTAATVSIAIALWSLRRNRTPAADGGFLQIMLATVGDTQIGRVILEQRVATIDDMTDELKSLRIRYGELVDENIIGAGSKRFGFGIVDETMSLRKRR